MTLDDAIALSALVSANREHLAPWQPRQAEVWFSEEGQAEGIRASLEAHSAGRQVPHVIVADGVVVGRIALNSVIRGAFQSASIAYWVDSTQTGRGIATAAVAKIVDLAFDDLQLHRVQGETLPRNAASRRVLEHNGFVEYGIAMDYLHIAGRWQDHVLYQRVHPGWTPGGSS